MPSPASNAPKRARPRGYVGRNHETIGSDILAVSRAVPNAAKLFDAETRRRLDEVKPDAWYPIEWLLDLMDHLHAKVGDAGLRKMGRELFKLSHAEQAKKVAKSARDILFGIDGMYNFANRGEEIGGWKVEVFRAGHAELLKTTPHHCIMEEGILMEALALMGAPSAISQSACLRKGADACRFVVRSTTTDARWDGTATREQR